MAFEEMSGPRTSIRPKQVFASFDSKSSPAGITTHRPSASLLKDTPPSIIVALSQLAPIVKTLNAVLALITWTGEDNWSSFLLLSSFWLCCLYGDLALHYAGNWLLLFCLGIGYFHKKMVTQKIVHAIEKGDNPITTGIEDTQTIMDATLYQIDCLRARCHLLSSTFEPIYRIFTWEEPQQSILIGMRLGLVTPLYLLASWFLTTRTLVLIAGTFFLTFTSPWFKVICTVCWRLRIVRQIATALIGVEYLPGESNILHALSSPPFASAFDISAKGGSSGAPTSLSDDSRFTTTIAVIENQRRWLGLGWTPSLLPHERAPFTDVDDHPGAAPENTALPAPKTTTSEDGITRTVHWKWIDSDWRIERDRGRDPDGWLYFDNTWRHPTATEEFGRYTRRRKWIRNAECAETVESPGGGGGSGGGGVGGVGHGGGASPAPTPSSTTRAREKDGTGGMILPAKQTSRTLDPEKVRVSTSTPSSTLVAAAAATTTTPVIYASREKSGAIQESPAVTVAVSSNNAGGTANGGPRKEWREISGGGRELVTVDPSATAAAAAGVRKRPFTLRRKSSRGSTLSAGVD